MTKKKIPWEKVVVAEGGKDRAWACIAYDKEGKDGLATSLPGTREDEMRLRGRLQEP